jgi:D-alanyl-D-alanine dipeptidase
MLRDIMKKHGFGTVPDEWWHYQWYKKLDFEVIDLDFDDLKEFIQ